MSLTPLSGPLTLLSLHPAATVSSHCGLRKPPPAGRGFPRTFSKHAPGHSAAQELWVAPHCLGDEAQETPHPKLFSTHSHQTCRPPLPPAPPSFLSVFTGTRPWRTPTHPSRPHSHITTLTASGASGRVGGEAVASSLGGWAHMASATWEGALPGSRLGCPAPPAPCGCQGPGTCRQTDRQKDRRQARGGRAGGWGV